MADSALTTVFEHLFSLTPEEREHLNRLTAKEEEIEPRRKLLTEGKACDGLFILKAGWIFKSKTRRNGSRQILNFRLPGDILGVECLAYKAPLNSTTTLTHCTVAPLTVKAFEQTQREFPRLATALFLMTLREGAILHEWEVNLGQRSAFERVAHLLLEMDRRLRMRGLAQDGSVSLPLTQEIIADCTGLTTPYVNRMIQDMRSKGLIRFEQQTLEILNEAGLSKAAGFDPSYIENWGGGYSSVTPP